MNWMDWAIVVAIMYGLLSGARKGLISSVLGLAGFVVAFLVVRWYSEPVADWLGKTFGWQKAIAGSMQKQVTLPTTGTGASSSIHALDQIGIPRWLSEPTMHGAATPANGSKSLLSNGISQDLAHWAIVGVAALLLLMVTGIVIRLVARALTTLVAYTPLGPANRLGGLVVGGLEAALIMIAIIGFVGMLAPTLPPFVATAWKHSMLVPDCQVLFSSLSTLIFPAILSLTE